LISAAAGPAIPQSTERTVSLLSTYRILYES
jgi:hypothetical protein